MIFVDSSFWIATQIPRDQRHSEAVALLRQMGDQRLITSNHVRGETWTFLRRRAGHPAEGRSARSPLICRAVTTSSEVVSAQTAPRKRFSS